VGRRLDPAVGEADGCQLGRSPLRPAGRAARSGRVPVALPGGGLAEISCRVVAGVRRRRVGTEPTLALAEWAFASTELERLEIVHSVLNVISCSVALQAGFRIEGVKRSLQRHADGFHDMCLHSRIRIDDGRPLESTDPTRAARNGVAHPRQRTPPDFRRYCQQ
jgi:RimJ/RimL family protein N-acetyltransferase